MSSVYLIALLLTLLSISPPLVSSILLAPPVLAQTNETIDHQTTVRDYYLRHCLDEFKVQGAHWPGSAEYTESLQPPDPFYAIKYSRMYVRATTASDVAGVLRCADAKNLNVVIRSGGHDYAGYSYGQNGDIIVDLSRLTHLSINQTSGIVEAGPGIRISTFYYNLHKNGKWMLPMGACTSVGLGGHIQGGSYGYYTPKYGLGVDYLVGAEVVLANGTVTWAGEGSDLLWAVQGGGAGHMGIVTQFRFKAIKAPEIVTSATLYYAPWRMLRILESLVLFFDSIPSELAMFFGFSRVGAFVQVGYVGNRTELDGVLAPFKKLAGAGISLFRQDDFLTSVGELSIRNIMDTDKPVGLPRAVQSVMSFLTNVPINFGTLFNAGESSRSSNRKVSTLDDLNTPPDFNPDRIYYKPHSLIWSDDVPLTESCVHALHSAFERMPASFIMSIDVMGAKSSAVRKKTNDQTGSSLRNVRMIGHMYARSYTKLKESDIAYVDSVFLKMKECSDARTYVNYKDQDLGEDFKDPITGAISGNGPAASLEYYGKEHLKKLTALKRIYNPKNQFWYPQAIRI